MEHIAEQKLPGKMTRAYMLAIFFIFCLWIIYSFIHTWEFDEAWTYLSVKNESYADLVAYRNFNIANNHLINSLWFKFLQQAGADHVIFYRSLSVLLFLPYIYFLRKAALYGNNWWQGKHDWLLIFFMLPPALIYFGAGRGYSLSMTMFVAALYYLKVHLQNRSARSYYSFLAAGILSCLAIVSFFYPFVAMLIYIHVRKKSWKQPFSPLNIITIVFAGALTVYTYHVGKTILKYDTIINGTDNLFVGGMYSTFISSLGLTELIFPADSLFVRWNLKLVVNIMLLASLVPVAFILLRKLLLKYEELAILIIMTVIFFLSHVLLKSKYPSDRSAIYLLYLIYIPVMLYLAQSKNLFFRIHYFIVFGFGILNFAGLMLELGYPNFYRIIGSKQPLPATVYSDWPNFADQVNNELKFGNSINFVYLIKSYERDQQLTDRKIRETAENPAANLLLIQEDNFLRNAALFSPDRFLVRRVSSSNLKLLYLIERK